jgi:hypothetical protein
VLDAGGELTVVAQNIDGTSTDALATRDQPVRLIWQRKHTQAIEGASSG